MKTVLVSMAMLGAVMSVNSHAAAIPTNKPIAVNMTLTQMGVPLKATFQKAVVTGNIPDQGAGDVTVTLQTNSLAGATQEAVSAGKGSEWLDAEKYPTAVFKSTSLQVNGGKGVAQGRLTIKGITKPAIASFTIQNGKVQGQMTFDRTQFQVGINDWASTSIVAAPVKIDFSF